MVPLPKIRPTTIYDKKNFPFIFCCSLHQYYICQLSDLAKIEYTYIPKGSANVGYDRIRGLFNYPIKLKNDDFLLIGLDYSNIDISFGATTVAFDKEVIEDFQLLDLNVGYTFKVNEDWRFGARITPSFSSNFVKNISFEDVVFFRGYCAYKG